MHQAELNRSAWSAATPATAPTAPTAATAPTAGARFPTLSREVQSDISHYIATGASDGEASLGGGALGALNPQGQWYRDQLQAGGEEEAGDPSEVQQQFIDSITAPAQDAARKLGVSADLVAAHAALESGWGRHPLRQAGGASSNNLFALKAGSSWQGARAASLTTEYENGSAQKRVETFRSYSDQASAFNDYAHLLLNNPRYAGALNTGHDAQAFASGLARGGYATDPAYAEKLARVARQIQSARQHGKPAVTLQSED